MSKLTALITTLVLGSSSAAIAGPGAASAVRDHRTSVTSYGARPIRASWIALSEPMELVRRDNVRIDQPMRLNQIRLQTTGGATFVSAVTVRYTDGTRQVVNLRRSLDARNPYLQFNLDSRKPIARIQVMGSSHRRAAYQIFGYGARLASHVPDYQPPAYEPMPPVAQPPVFHPNPGYGHHEGRGVLLASALNFVGTTGYKMIAVGADKGRLSTLQLQGLGGVTYIKRIEVQFTDGRGQTLSAVDRALRAGEVLDIPLDGAGASAVRQIIVFTNDTLTPVDHMTGEFSLRGF